GRHAHADRRDRARHRHLGRRTGIVARPGCPAGPMVARGHHDLGRDARRRHTPALTPHERMRRDASMDFHRMLTWARDLIRDAPGVCAALRRRIRVLIVDEFQDVDPVQKEIAYLLADPLSRATNTPRLMLVGDPKQSIYAFRGADVTVWNSVQRDFAERGAGIVMHLADNFRSVAPILAFVASAIGPQLDEPVQGDELQDFEIPFHPVQATRTDGPDNRAVEFIVVPRNADTRPALGIVRASEAEAVAQRMLQLHAAHGTNWRDMAILLTGWGALDTYAAA